MGGVKFMNFTRAISGQLYKSGTRYPVCGTLSYPNGPRRRRVDLKVSDRPAATPEHIAHERERALAVRVQTGQQTGCQQREVVRLRVAPPGSAWGGRWCDEAADHRLGGRPRAENEFFCSARFHC